MTLTYIFHSGFEMEETFNPIAHEKQFLGELKDIRKVADSFDVVMFPIDGRVGNGYTMKEFTDEKDISFWEITREGETIEI